MPGIAGSGRHGRRDRCSGCHAKAANVRLLSHEVLDPGRLTLWWKAIWRRVVRRWTQVVLPHAYRACHQPQGDRSARR